MIPGDDTRSGADAQVEAYREKGFVVVEDIYSPDEVARMCEVLDEIVDAARSVRTHDEVYDLEPSHSPERPRVRRIKTPWHVHPLFREMVEQPRLIAVLTRLIGPALRLHGGKINLKSAEYGSPVEWHQDWAFYPHTNDDVLAVGVMLDDMTPDNGPLLIVPGSDIADRPGTTTTTGVSRERSIRGRATWTHFQPEWRSDDRSKPGCDHGLLGRSSPPVGRSVQLPSRARGARLGAEHVGARPAAAALRGRGRGRLGCLQGLVEGSWDAQSWENMIAGGEPTIEPRMAPASVRLPFPGAERAGSIYENQSVMRNRYFERDASSARAEAGIQGT